MGFDIWEIPIISVEQMREVDRRMTEDYRINLLQMMEMAGRNLTDILNHPNQIPQKENGSPPQVAVLSGKGNNGGGGLVAARHLHNRGWKVSVFLPEKPASKAALHQLATLKKMGLPLLSDIRQFENTAYKWIIDAMIGYSLQGAPASPFAQFIKAANHHPAPILALDLPSGLCADSGVPLQPTIQAALTLTLALPKKGLFAPSAEKYVGELILGDIGVPSELLKEMGITENFYFNQGPLIPLTSLHARRIREGFLQEFPHAEHGSNLCVSLNPK
ncbi:MAG: hypothetical protein Kow0037_11400 [Calditrichia bacterium]